MWKFELNSVLLCFHFTIAIITARVQSTTGGYVFTWVCLLKGRRGVLQPLIPGPSGGGRQERGSPSQDRGYLLKQDKSVPPQTEWGGGRVLWYPQQKSKCYYAMPLAVTQEAILLFSVRV